MDNNNVAIAALALTGTLATGFFALIAKQNRTHEKLAKSIDLMASASKEVAKATVKSAREAEQRNGHLGELVSQGNELTSKMYVQQLKTASIAAEDRDTLTTTDQHIDQQVVAHQIVKEK